MPERLEHIKEVVTNNAPMVIYTNGAATVGFSFVDLMTSIQTYAWAITLVICILTFVGNHYFKWCEKQRKDRDEQRRARDEQRKDREERRRDQEHKIRMAERLLDLNKSADGPITKEFLSKFATLDDVELQLNRKPEIPDSKQ